MFSPPHPVLQLPVFQVLDEFPAPIEPVRLFLGVTVTLTASTFDCPLPSASMPCSDAFLGNSPMQCTWINGGEVRLVGVPKQPTLGDPKTDSSFKFSVIMLCNFCPLHLIAHTAPCRRCPSRLTTSFTRMAPLDLARWASARVTSLVLFAAIIQRCCTG
jgi:hypothetical protein